MVQVGRFQYHKNAMQKICAPVEHPMQLELEKGMLSQNARKQNAVYNLAAKVVHHGTCDEQNNFADSMLQWQLTGAWFCFGEI